LAAAVLARAVGHPLLVFIPPGADPKVVDRLRRLGARLETCPRAAGSAGDPCYRMFRRAVSGGALPFTCQGPENGLVVEGGATIGYEIVSTLMAGRSRLDRLFVQVGGGALASSCLQAFREAAQIGLIARRPRLFAVQTRGAHPLRLAYDKVASRIFDRCGRGAVRAQGDGEGAAPGAGNDEERAQFLAVSAPAGLVEDALRYAAAHRSEFMAPWPETPSSLAAGILDDETYDWLAVVRGMIATGGYPVVVSEEDLVEAQSLASLTSIPADPTGTAGLAGCARLMREGMVGSEETVGVLFTGVRR
jgi:threonine synthase